MLLCFTPNSYSSNLHWSRKQSQAVAMKLASRAQTSSRDSFITLLKEAFVPFPSCFCKGDYVHDSRTSWGQQGPSDSSRTVISWIVKSATLITILPFFPPHQIVILLLMLLFCKTLLYNNNVMIIIIKLLLVFKGLRSQANWHLFHFKSSV